jgi:hypothetical protein
MEDVGVFLDIWSILQPFGILKGHLVYFPLIWYVVPRKIWQPWNRPLISYNQNRGGPTIYLFLKATFGRLAAFSARPEFEQATGSGGRRNFV